MAEDDLRKSASELIRRIPPEDLSRLVVAVADSAQRVLEIREISRARREEVENRLALLRANTTEDLARLDRVAECLEALIEFLGPKERAKMVDTICQLALGREIGNV